MQENFWKYVFFTNFLEIPFSKQLDNVFQQTLVKILIEFLDAVEEFLDNN